MKKNSKIIISYCEMTNDERGIKLRSGKVVLPRESYYDYSDSDSDDNSYGYLHYSSDEEDTTLPVLEWDYVREGYDKFISLRSGSQESVKESSEKKVSSEIEVPNGFGDEAGNFLKKFNECYQDCFISHDQLNELVKIFAKQLSWFPDNVSPTNIKKYCREAYTHYLEVLCRRRNHQKAVCKFDEKIQKVRKEAQEFFEIRRRIS